MVKRPFAAYRFLRVDTHCSRPFTRSTLPARWGNGRRASQVLVPRMDVEVRVLSWAPSFPHNVLTAAEGARERLQTGYSSPAPIPENLCHHGVAGCPIVLKTFLPFQSDFGNGADVANDLMSCGSHEPARRSA